MVIDGNDNEWQDCQLYYDPKTQTTIGVYNDDAYVYLCFVTKDTDIWTAFVRQGFFIWFNETGGKDKALGVRYPIAGQPGDQGAPPGGQGGQGAPPGEQGDQGAPPVGPGGDTVSVAELQILTSEKDTGKTFKLTEAAQLDINARIATDQSGKLIYELKIPLKRTDTTPYAVVPSKLNSIGIGFMTVSAGRRSTSGISGFGGGISDMGSRGGGGGGGMGGGRGTGSTSKSVEIWTNILLASKP